LNSLSAGAFHNVVDRAHQDRAAGARIQAPCDINKVCSANVFGIGKTLGAEQTDKRLIAIRLLVNGGDRVSVNLFA